MSSQALPFTTGTKTWERVAWVPLDAYPQGGVVDDGQRIEEPVAAFRAIQKDMALFVGRLPEGAAVDLVVRGDALPPRVIPLPTNVVAGVLQVLVLVCPAHPGQMASHPLADDPPLRRVP